MPSQTFVSRLRKWWILWLLLPGMLSLGWFVWSRSYLERAFRYLEAPVYGKQWAAEVEKSNNLYPPARPGAILFLGDSHMEQCEWQELFPDYQTLNRGIGGETSSALVQRIDTELKNQDSLIVFLQIGINDLIAGISPEAVLANHERIFRKVKHARCFLQPCLLFYTRYLPAVNEKVGRLNQILRKFYEKNGMRVLDLNPEIAPEKCLLPEFTSDGLHLNAAGYKRWQLAVRHRLTEASGSR